MSTQCSKAPTSKVPSALRNFMRLIEARLQAESSTCMYSEHGFDALMRPEFGDVCHWLIVVDRKSTRLNSSHANISYAVFCLKKKKKQRYTDIYTLCR